MLSEPYCLSELDGGVECVIVVPTLNENDNIAECLASLLVPAAAEYIIVVADGGSDDNTRALVGEIAKRDERVILVANPGRTQAHAVNMVANRLPRHCKWLVRADAHSTYPADFLTKLVQAAVDHPGASSVVVSMHAVGKTRFEHVAATAQNTRLGNGGSLHRTDRCSGMFVDHGHHALFDLDRFRGAGGYDGHFTHNEDYELDYRFQLSGGRIWLVGDMAIAYRPRSTARALAKQYFNFGKGRARSVFKHRLIPKVRQMLPLLAFLLYVAGLVILPISSVVFAVSLAHLAVCMAWGAKLGLERHSAAVALCGPLAALMHVSWGAGFCFGAMAHADYLISPRYAGSGVRARAIADCEILSDCDGLEARAALQRIAHDEAAISRAPEGEMISVVVPTRNRVHTLREVAESYFQQEQVDEIIFVVDDSEDGTPAFLHELGSRYPRVILQVVFNSQRCGAAACRNKGVLLARNDYILFVDDDEYLEDGYAKTCLAKLQQTGAGAVSGRRVYMLDRESKDQALRRFGCGSRPVAPFNSLVCEYVNGAKYTADIEMPLTNAIILTRKSLLLNYPFDEHYARGNGYREESDYQMNLYVNGYKIIVTNEVHSLHLPLAQVRTGGQRSSMFGRIYWSIHFTNYFYDKYYPAYSKLRGLRASKQRAKLVFGFYSVYKESLRPILYRPALAVRTWLMIGGPRRTTVNGTAP